MRWTGTPLPSARQVAAARYPRLRRAWTILSVVGAFLLALPPASRADELLTFDVAVLDERGQPVGGLGAENFLLTDEGKRREIVAFEAVDNAPRTFVLLLDDLGLPPELEGRTRDAMNRLIDVGFRKGDVMTLATTSGTWWSGTMPSFAKDARAILERMEGKGLSTIRTQRDRRARACFGAVEKAARTLQTLPGRKSLLLFATGLEGLPRETMLPLIALCRRSGLVVYLFGLAASMVDRTLTSENLPGKWQGVASFTPFRPLAGQELAEASGGRVNNATDVVGMAVKAAAELGASYRLSVRPLADVGPREWREIDVSVAWPGLEVRAPMGYSPADPGKPVAAGDAALFHGHQIVDVVEAAGFILDAPRENAVRVMVAVERGPTAGAEAEPLAVRMRLDHRDTGETREARVELAPAQSGTVSTEFELQPGLVQVRVVAVGERSGRFGAVTRRIEVPAAGELRISTPILTDEIRGKSNGRPPQPVLRARQTFTAGGRLFCQFQVYGAEDAPGTGPSVEATYLLRRPDGALVREGQRSRIAPSRDGRLVRLLGISLEGLAAGSYELVLQAEDTQARRSAEVVGHFEIRPAPPATR